MRPLHEKHTFIFECFSVQSFREIDKTRRKTMARLLSRFDYFRGSYERVRLRHGVQWPL